MGFALERLGGILLIVTAGAFFAGLIVTLLFGVSKAADLTSFIGGGMFKKEYMTDFKTQLQGNQAVIAWQLKNEKDIQDPRVYYVNSKDILSSDQLRSTQYGSGSKKGDFAQNAKTEVALGLLPGVSRAEIVAVNKEGEAVQKKEIIFMIFNQEMLDSFDQELPDKECYNRAKCDVMFCKEKTDLNPLYSKIGLRTEELKQLAASLNSQCKVLTTSLRPSSGLSGCKKEEIQRLFEDALTLKANEKISKGDGRSFGEIRQELYDGTFAKQCTDTLRKVLKSRGWEEIQ